MEWFASADATDTGGTAVVTNLVIGFIVGMLWGTGVWVWAFREPIIDALFERWRDRHQAPKAGD